MELFQRSWAALRTSVAGLPPAAFGQPSGCTGWLVRDLVGHLVICAQDVLIVLATPADGAPTRDAAGYWEVLDAAPSGDPLDALSTRLAAAYGDPALLQHHLEDLGAAAGRAAGRADPAELVGSRGQVLAVADYLHAYVLEWTLHHLDLIAHLPGVAGPPADGLAAARALLERIAGVPIPGLDDREALLAGTGRTAGPPLPAPFPLVLT